MLNGETRCTAEWLGFTFMDMRLSEMEKISEAPAEAPSEAADDAAEAADGASEAADGAAEEADGAAHTGTLHYKYIPRTGEWGTADAEYAVLTPSATPYRRVTAQWHGRGSVRFHRAEWRDLPTQYHIVNAFEELEVVAFRGASIVETVGGKDLSDQRILR